MHYKNYKSLCSRLSVDACHLEQSDFNYAVAHFDNKIFEEVRIEEPIFIEPV
jgi:hypothetical protein